jgi:hypothetical protein
MLKQKDNESTDTQNRGHKKGKNKKKTKGTSKRVIDIESSFFQNHDNKDLGCQMIRNLTAKIFFLKSHMTVQLGELVSPLSLSLSLSLSLPPSPSILFILFSFYWLNLQVTSESQIKIC